MLLVKAEWIYSWWVFLWQLRVGQQKGNLICQAVPSQICQEWQQEGRFFFCVSHTNPGVMQGLIWQGLVSVILQLPKDSCQTIVTKWQQALLCVENGSHWNLDCNYKHWSSSMAKEFHIGETQLNLYTKISEKGIFCGKDGYDSASSY